MIWIFTFHRHTRVESTDLIALCTSHYFYNNKKIGLLMHWSPLINGQPQETVSDCFKKDTNFENGFQTFFQMTNPIRSF